MNVLQNIELREKCINELKMLAIKCNIGSFKSPSVIEQEVQNIIGEYRVATLNVVEGISVWKVNKIYIN